MKKLIAMVMTATLFATPAAFADDMSQMSGMDHSMATSTDASNTNAAATDEAKPAAKNKSTDCNSTKKHKKAKQKAKPAADQAAAPAVSDQPSAQ